MFTSSKRKNERVCFSKLLGHENGKLGFCLILRNEEWKSDLIILYNTGHPIKGRDIGDVLQADSKGWTRIQDQPYKLQQMSGEIKVGV